MKNEPCVLVLNANEKPRKCPRQKGWMECPYSVLAFWSGPRPHWLTVSWTSWVGKGWWGWVFTGGFCSQANLCPSLIDWFGHNILGSVKKEKKKERREEGFGWDSLCVVKGKKQQILWALLKNGRTSIWQRYFNTSGAIGAFILLFHVSDVMFGHLPSLKEEIGLLRSTWFSGLAQGFLILIVEGGPGNPSVV